MEEIEQIWLKYEEQGLLDHVESLDDVNRLALTFCEDVTRTYRLVTLQRNPNGDPFGYGLGDAPIVGLLTRVAKLFRLVCKFYELDKGDHLAVFSRPLIESAIVATYLLHGRRRGSRGLPAVLVQGYAPDTSATTESGSGFFRTHAGEARSAVRRGRPRPRGAVDGELRPSRSAIVGASRESRCTTSSTRWPGQPSIRSSTASCRSPYTVHGTIPWTGACTGGTTGPSRHALCTTASMLG